MIDIDLDTFVTLSDDERIAVADALARAGQAKRAATYNAAWFRRHLDATQPDRYRMRPEHMSEVAVRGMSRLEYVEGGR